MEYDNLSQAALAERDESKEPALYSPVPWEVIEHMVNYLDNRSIKSLRLTCRLFGALKLRINRVFISPHSADIMTFYAIAENDVYRPDIVEVVYDDAFVRYPLGIYDSVDGVPALYPRCMSTEMARLKFEADENIEEIDRRYGRDVRALPKRLRKARRAGAKLSMNDARQLLVDLEEDQRHNINKGADAEALRCALRHLPALQRITVTPAAHGCPFTPLYETPMIRSIPLGMNYPIPRGWPTRPNGSLAMLAEPWEEGKQTWRGYNMVTKLLAEEKHHHRVSELLIDAHSLYTGLSCRLFEQLCEEYYNFQTILQQPNFKKLQLSLHVDGQKQPNVNWAAFRNNLLRNAIAEASQLEHFSIETDWETGVMDPRIQPPTLQTFLPIERWAGLQHFRLWNFPLRSADLISALSQLTGLQSLELGFLGLHRGDNYHDLLNDMRGTLRLHERSVPPRVRFGIPVPESIAYSCAKYFRGRAIWLDKEVEAFLYQGGDNLFIAGGNFLARVVGVVRDAFDPAYERPYARLTRVDNLYKKRVQIPST